MKYSKRALVTLGLVLGVAAPAAALVPLPDMCGWGGCITFTHTTALAQVESLINQATGLANEARNLSSLGNSPRQAINEKIGAITGINGQSTPLSLGDNAAQQTLDQVQAAAQNIASIDSSASGADGAKQQAQVSNLYLSTIAGELTKANVRSAQEHIQHKNESDVELQGLREFFSANTDTTVTQP